MKIEVCDMNGRIVYSQKLPDVIPDGLFEIENSTLGNGIYFLRVYEKTTMHSMKLVKY